MCRSMEESKLGLTDILALSIHNLRYPFHGNARLVLGSLGALALAGSEVVYINACGRSGSEEDIKVSSHYGAASLKVVHTPGRISSNPFRYLSDARSFQVSDNAEVILCEDRRLIALCRRLASRYSAPLIIRIDSLRHFYHRDLIATSAKKVSQALATPLALFTYFASAMIADAAVGVCKDFESLSRWTLGRVHTVEPTYMLLDSANDVPHAEPIDIDELPDYLVLCSCPPKMSAYLALKTPEIRYVITGPAAYYTEKFVTEKLGGKICNLVLLHNINDTDLEKIHKKIKLAVIARPLLTGISMTLIEELYFGKPIVTDLNTASRNERLTNSRAVLIENDYSKWPTVVKRLLGDSERLQHMKTAADRFFDQRLSPRVHANLMQKAINTLMES